MYPTSHSMASGDKHQLSHNPEKKKQLKSWWRNKKYSKPIKQTNIFYLSPCKFIWPGQGTYWSRKIKPL